MRTKIIFILNLIWVLTLKAQIGTFQPSIGYVYPAGGKAGDVVEIFFGGQNLRGVTDLYFSYSDAIKVETIIYIPPLNNMERNYLTRKIFQLMRGRRRISDDKKEVKLPENPLLKNLEDLSQDQLYKIFEIFVMPLRREQVKRSIQEKVFVRFKIKENLPPGKYEMRLVTQRGLTNPLSFEVSNINEFYEREPNNPDRYEKKIVFDAPVVINGRIMPGDCDRFYFKAKKGQKLFIKLKAREIIPYMADAVPGWFQGVLTLYNSEGKEISYADDYYFNPDPIIHYKFEEDGEYIIEVRDALYRGREDFVYRLYIVENERFLNENKMDFFSLQDELPEIEEREPNDTLNKAQFINIPKLIKGTIEKQSDIDTFKFKGKKGEIIAFEVYSRKIGYPLDSYIRIMDSSGKILLSNDDYQDEKYGLITHFADSYLLFKVPEDGEYFLQILDIQNHYGKDYIYYIRAEKPRPDFDVFIVPSSINIPASGIAVFEVYVFKKDGFDNEITLSIKEPDYGFKLSGGKIPKGKDSLKITVSCSNLSKGIYEIELEAVAYIDGKEIRKKVIPAEKMMQAFAYYHLVPAEKVLVYLPRRIFSQFELINQEILKIPSGGKANVKIKVPFYFKGEEVSLELKEPPEGISIENINVENGILSFDVKAEDKIKPGFSDNLIIEIYRKFERERDGKKIEREVAAGFLPAISFEII